MATKETNPQIVTIRADRYEVEVINEARTKYYTIKTIIIYDNAGDVATLSTYNLHRVMWSSGNREIMLSIPAVWNSRKAPSYTEARAHFTRNMFYGTSEYTLYIPIEAVTVESVSDRASKSTGYTERRYTVSGFPASFTRSYRHPFDHYAAQHAAEQLAKDSYDILTPRTINTPEAQERIAQFVHTLETFAAEAQRVKDMSDDEFISECLEAYRKAQNHR